MEFITDESLKHPIFKDVTRINYNEDEEPQLINDYGYSYLMFRYGDISAQNYKGEEVIAPKQFVKGTGDFFTITAKANSSWVSIEMQNHILHNITGEEAIKNRNTLIDLNQFVDQSVVNSLYREIENLHNPKEIASVLDNHLGNYYKKWSNPIKSTPIVSFIYEIKGMISVKELSNKVAISERSLERLFAKEVGASPRRFISLVRFNFTIRELERQNYNSLVELIEKYNYYDQSHFEKDFKKFLGQSIVNYKNSHNPLLTNGLSRAYVKLKNEK